jgi:NADH-quinone oxidoreductase subunit M
VPLTAFITVIVVIAGWESITERVNQYMGAFLILSGLMIGVFCALDGMLFYVFFEATLIPMYLIIGIWGGPNKIYAAFKFFLYTLLGSLLMLIALIYLYNQVGWQLRHPDLAQAAAAAARRRRCCSSPSLQPLRSRCRCGRCTPGCPTCTWRRPPGGSAVLAAIMLKLGAYGFLRFSMPIAPDASREWAWLMIALSLIAVIYIGLVAMVQKDMKKLVAYSSVAHMGFCHAGLLHLQRPGRVRRLVQMIAHGFVSGAMFLCIGVLYDRVHSREIASYGGVVNTMPKFTAFALLFAMANCGLPGTAGFVGEWMVILGAVKATSGSACCCHRADLRRCLHAVDVQAGLLGPVANDHVKATDRHQQPRILMLALLAMAVLWHGPVSQALHRRDGRFGGRVAQARGPVQAELTRLNREI